MSQLKSLLLLNTKQKSVLFARARGWELQISATSDGVPDCILMDEQPRKVSGGQFSYSLYPGAAHEEGVFFRMCPDFYELVNMKHAWDTMAWALNKHPDVFEYELREFWGYVALDSRRAEYAMEPLLDFILDRCISNEIIRPEGGADGK